MDSIFNPNADDITKKIIVSLERISQSFRVLLWEQAKEYRLSPIQIQILIFCMFHPAEKRKIGHLALEFSLTKPTVSDAVKSLEKKGLILKIKEEDARSYSIQLTEKGKEITEKTSHFANSMEKGLSSLSVNEKNTFFMSLLQMIHSLNKQDIITVQRMCFTCFHYQKEKDNHYCTLIKKPLKTKELRVDCPEHQAIST
ncbi:MarR family winged helix-turn-helix transcriptional regulator [Aquimarina hainanensis]|uniref:MarR family winged helix-turn-helix transcriptional regulator n=1 Tax=Aquimarina hainanensis TaxID=1578017 RepID=A0ABW5NA21_9FLAO|nr:MarR family winged helix-turn-helix transcriptional regulator [Aquimarina sp. TRL1]QKX03677.1 winged helix-turn-helix transcriptional regulator [Aquimarina sp. TRL1]